MEANDLMDRHGGDNRQQNTPAEIYANVRDKALEEAAVICETAPDRLRNSTFDGAAAAIRALKRTP
jgi:hypothetical protein